MHWLYWILALIVSFAAAYWVYRADVKRAVPYPWLTAGLRGLIIFLTALLLLAPAITVHRYETQKPVVVILQDESSSIARELHRDSSTFRKNVNELIDKLSDNYKVIHQGFGSEIQTDSLYTYQQRETDIAGALQKVEEAMGSQNLGAVILASDGRYNQGANPLLQQFAFKVPVYTAGIGDTATQKDLRIANTYANKTVAARSRFEIKADVLAKVCNGYSNSIQLLENGSVVANTPISISGDRFDKSVSFSISTDKPGLHHYIVNAPVAEGEENTANNRRDVFVEVVEDKKQILLAAAAPHPDVNAIQEALKGMDAYQLTVKIGDAVPASFSAYQVVILHQLPSTFQNLSSQDMRKPAWYILGTQTNPPTLNRVQQAAGITYGNLIARNVFPLYNTSFSGFTLPQGLQSVLDKMPPLSVTAANVQAAASTTALFNQKDNPQQPLWFFQQGNAPTAMLLGEGLWRWRMYEYKNFGKHDVVDECIRQTIAFLAANTNDKPFRAVLPKYVWSDQEAITIGAYLLNANNEQINTPEAKISITDSANRKRDFSFERSGNSYRINTGIWPGGTYNYTATTSYNGKTLTSTGSFTVALVPLEMMETGADYNLLYGLAHKYNGSFVPAANIVSLYDTIANNKNIKPIIQTNTETAPLVDWKWFFFVILLLAVAEWLLRKYWMAQ
ncbi:MAG: VWA domain-containing protein [Sphingobacteriales bacterium]|nr:MAG: VWA domain-containing protein [Sphingobacteriales bacterium]